MGSWNGTCAISNLHITHGTPVTVFILLEQRGTKSYCHTNAQNDLCPVPFYGEYDDYGGVEKCHGFALDIVVEAIRDQLYEFGTGANKYHDIPINKDNFNIEKLFAADGEDRLGIHQSYNWNGEEYARRELELLREKNGLTSSQEFELNRLADKIKKIDTFRRVSHVIVHGTVFRDIMDKWYIEDYVGRGKGEHGYYKSYNHIYFKDIIAHIPDYILEEKERRKDIENETDSDWRSFLLSRSLADSYNSSNPVAKWLSTLSRGSMMFGLINAEETIKEYKNQNDWDGVAKFIHEVLTTLWINAFMDNSRKLWSRQCGMGSQNSNHLAYRILTQSMNNIMDAERDEDD